MSRRPLAALAAAAFALGAACDRGAPNAAAAPAAAPAADAAPPPDESPDAVAPAFRNLSGPPEYAGDAACATCHAAAAAEYARNAMARSFHQLAPAGRGPAGAAPADGALAERPLDAPVVHPRTGLQYTVVADSGRLYQVEALVAPDGRRLHELRRRMDYVMGSGAVARSYFTEENGRLFQLPLTLYRQHGWDFSPGYQKENLRFDRMLPDRCVACHASYPAAYPRLEGKYAELRPGIGCERCHGPGALHARTWRARGVAPAPTAAPRPPGDTTGYDPTIVNPRRLTLERRLDVCEQCHVHTDVTVLREGRGSFDYQPSQPLREQYAFFRAAGKIDLVSHADRLRQSRCFVASRRAARPLECATCHAPHAPPPADSAARAAANTAACTTCHAPAALARQVPRAARAQHQGAANCAGCHMPSTRATGLPHGGFVDHWIRVPGRGPADPPVAADGPDPAVARYVQAYYGRDRVGPEAAVYQGAGAVVYGSLAGRADALGDGARALDAALRAAPAGGGAGAAGRPAARVLLGAAYQQLGRPAEALDAFAGAARADSANPEALRALAQAALQAGRPPADAERLYRRALAAQPRLAAVRAELADLLDAQGRGAEAVAEYRAAVAEQPGLAPAWFHLGAALAGADRTAEAVAAFGRALRLDPTLGQGLAPLVAVRVQGGRAVEARAVGLEVPSLLVRDRGPGALRVDAAPGGASGGAAGGAAGAGVLVVNVPPGAAVRVLRYDGTVARTLPPADGRGAVVWDLRTDAGGAAGGGLYRAVAQAPGPDGRPGRPRAVLFGVARRPGA